MKSTPTFQHALPENEFYFDSANSDSIGIFSNLKRGSIEAIAQNSTTKKNCSSKRRDWWIGKDWGVRAPEPDETPLSESEVDLGILHRSIDLHFPAGRKQLPLQISAQT